MPEELCNATYLAHQIGGTVVILAFGKHNTEGFEVRFRDTPIAIFLPEFELVHTPPEGATAQVETEFVTHTTFPASDPVKSVRVHDVNGRNEVRVEQSPNITATCTSDRSGPKKV
jgi:hypothetical protein